jgi:hypothetical protein
MQIGAPVIAALIAAFAAIFMGIGNLYAGYRLKRKEFRVAQIKSRIDTLEQAAVSSGPASHTDDQTEENDPLLRAVNAVKAAAWHRLTATENQYAKYKWLLNTESHVPLEKLLAECNQRSSNLAMASTERDHAKFQRDLPEFVGKTHELQKAYEAARLASIEGLYFILKKEVGI